MIEAPAEVVRVDGGTAWVRLSEKQGGCGRCDEPGGCRSMRITDTFGSPNQVFTLDDPLGLHPGERVRITIPDGAPLRAALLSYGLAVLLMLGGAAAGSLFSDAGQADLGAGLGVLCGLGLAVFINRLLARSRNWRGGLRMTLSRDLTACSHAHHS
ncbi:Fis family transcriptional regulator [Parazoarcus communis]|uniref:Fis family transcriptional regulator n=1 Tax=Parazoarcus communis TaxID=41977 RepID=A0A2U8H6U1_9RHOO|nr:SoxR reducing system RseC family protein [Parazoarcus communis]AWI80896.1 Fis family transcriptional regulator [Parazoarcus communis]